MWRLKQIIKAIRQSLALRIAAGKSRRVRARWQARSKNLPRSSDGKTMLHIGCGSIDAPGFVNIDARPQPHVHIVTQNLFALDMIPPNSIDLIYMSHVLEHVGHAQTIDTIREMHRVLKEGGVFRVSVPDFDKIVSIYLANDRDLACVEGALMGGQDYPFNFHYAAFNREKLAGQLSRVGFKTVRDWNPSTVEHHQFEDWASTGLSIRDKLYPVSLNVEAIK